MAMTFDQFVAGEARAYFISMLRLQEEFDFLLRLDRLFGRLDEATKVIDDERKHIRFLQDFVHVRLFNAALAYVRGQRADSFGLTRGGVEAAINAFLLHRHIVSPAIFEEGGRTMQDIYRTLSNPQHRNYTPDLRELLNIRTKLSKWGAHSEFAAYIFRLSEEGDQAFFSFFDAPDVPNDFRFYFIAVVSMFADAAEVFCAIAHEIGEPWAAEIAREIHKLKTDTEVHARKLGFLRDYPEEGPARA